MTDLEKAIWVLESEVFPESHARMREAVLACDAEVVLWKDAWLADESWPRLADRTVVFQGSLGVADTLARRASWRPGSFGASDGFSCSEWYPRATEWLLHERWILTTAIALAESPRTALERVGATERAFVRPDSPLKPFSGRVLHHSAISLAALDHGFYFDDRDLPVIVAPVRTVTREWRYVVVSCDVVAGSAYAADGRTALPDDPRGEPWKFAAEIAARIEAPQPVYVLDVCEADGRLWLLELNPFSGADLYACDRSATVRAVTAVASQHRTADLRTDVALRLGSE